MTLRRSRRGAALVAGFISGEGSFIVEIRKSKAYKAGGRVTLTFKFYQHIRDEYLIRSFVDYFGCGSCYSTPFLKKKGVDYVEYKCQVFQHIYDIIPPFFQKHPIIGVKSLDYQD